MNEFKGIHPICEGNIATKGKQMTKTILATAKSIEKAMEAGNKRNYNHTIKSAGERRRLLENHFNRMLLTVKSDEAKQRILDNKIENRHGAYLPITLALIHKHKAGEPCEDHARVYLTSDPSRIFDIPMANWINMSTYFDLLASRNNLNSQ